MDISSDDVSDVLVTIGPPLLRFVFVLLAIKIGIHMVRRLLGKTPSKYSSQMSYLAPKVIWVIGLIVAFGTIGINITSFLTLFATIGIGAALVFTPFGQGLIAGFLSGANGHVTEGDVIDVLGRSGRITKKGALALSVEYPDGSMAYLPNVRAVDSELINHNRVDGARIRVEIKLNMTADWEKAVSIMEKTLTDLEWRRQDKPTAVHFVDIGAAALHYYCYVWIDHRLDEPGFKSELLTTLFRDLQGAGISCGETADHSISSWPSTPETATLDLSTIEAALAKAAASDETARKKAGKKRHSEGR